MQIRVQCETRTVSDSLYEKRGTNNAITSLSNEELVIWW